LFLLEQADVEIDFELTSIGSADPFDPSWLLDIEKQCREAGASAHGPFGLVVLASESMEEHTSVHFRVYYRSQEKHMVLMCADLRKSVQYTCTFNLGTTCFMFVGSLSSRAFSLIIADRP
jgi:hypothetical protein